MLVKFYGYEDLFDPKQVPYLKDQTVKQVFQKLLEAQQISDELGFEISSQNVIVVLKKDNTRLVNFSEQVESLMKQTKQEELGLMLVCPTEDRGALIEYRVNQTKCYFENYVNKNDKLETFVTALCRKINFQQGFEIRVNGKKDDSRSPFYNKTIKQLIGTSSSQKITVEINKLEKREGEVKVQKEQKDQQQGRKGKGTKVKAQIKKQAPKKQQRGLQSDKEIQKRIQLQSEANMHQPKLESEVIRKSPDRNGGLAEKTPIGSQQEKVKINGKVQKQQKLLPQKSYAQSQLLKRQQPPKNSKSPSKNPAKYLFSVHFQTSTGIRSQTYEAQQFKTIRDILPDLLETLAEAGFDWDTNWKSLSDYQDKLAIYYGQQHYQKYQVKFMSVFSTISSKRTHDFQFKRLYQGG